MTRHSEPERSCRSLSKSEERLRQDGDGQNDQEDTTDQEESPHAIRHDKAEAMLIPRSIRDRRYNEKNHVGDSERDQRPAPDNRLRKRGDHGFLRHLLRLLGGFP